MPRSAGSLGYLLPAGEAKSLTSRLLLGCRGAGAKKRNREDKGQVSNPLQLPLMAMAALRLPCCQPGAGPCSSLTIPSPMDQTVLSTSSAGMSEAPDPLMEGNGVSTSREVLPEGPEAAQGRMLSQGPELLSNSPPHRKDKVSLGGAGCSISNCASPWSLLWWHQASTQHLPTLQAPAARP